MLKKIGITDSYSYKLIFDRRIYKINSCNNTDIFKYNFTGD